MMGHKQIITIKGNQEGLIFYIDDTSSFQDAIDELEKTIANTPSRETDNEVSIIINLGNRYVTDEQEQLLMEIIESDKRFSIERFDSNVISKLAAEEMFEQVEIKSFSRIIRSGQVLEVKGDLLLLGDVNPGGEVRATGSIYVVGKLQGIAHAGINGNKEAVIIASYMEPSQLRISNLISRPSDNEKVGTYMEYGFIDKELQQISITNLRSLQYFRNKLRGIEEE